MKKTAVITAVTALAAFIFASCTGIQPPTTPVTNPTVNVSILKTYPIGSTPRIRPNSAGYLVTYYDYGDIWLMQADAAGDCVWAKSYRQGAASIDYIDRAYGLAVGTDGFYLTGDTHPLTGGAIDDYHDFFAIKTDLTGNEVWRRYINTKENFGAGVITDTDGAIFTMIDYATGPTLTLIKYKGDATGDTVWTKTSPLTDYEMPGLVWNGTNFFFSGVYAGGASTEMISSLGTGSGALDYALTGTFNGPGPSDTVSCARTGGGYITIRAYRTPGSAQNDIMVLASGSNGLIAGNKIFGRPLADEFPIGVVNNGTWTLIPVAINTTGSEEPYVLLLNSEGNFVKEIPLAGANHVDSICLGKNTNQFIVTTSTNYIDMQIRSIDIN